MSYIIGVDCGTSGTKTVLFDELGTVVAHTLSNIQCISLKTAMRNRIPTTGLPL